MHNEPSNQVCKKQKQNQTRDSKMKTANAPNQTEWSETNCLANIRFYNTPCSHFIAKIFISRNLRENAIHRSWEIDMHRNIEWNASKSIESSFEANVNEQQQMKWNEWFGSFHCAPFIWFCFCAFFSTSSERLDVCRRFSRVESKLNDEKSSKEMPISTYIQFKYFTIVLCYIHTR